MTRDRAIAIAIFALVLASRAPFAAETLWAHDSALYANALERGFHVDDDLSQQRPHPPGYLLYVATAMSVRAAGLGTNDSLVAVSAVASALAAAALFLLARRWVTSSLSFLIAVAFAANPLVWLYSEIAYPYTTLALWSICVASACSLARGRGMAAAIGASVTLGVASGFRQDLLLLLAPLWLWTVSPLGRRMLVALATLVGTCLSWFIPSALLSGGLSAYVSSLGAQVGYVRATYSFEMQGLPALLSNTTATAWAVGCGLLLLAPLVLWSLVTMIQRVATRRGDVSDAFFALWTVPPLAVYLVLHIGDWGYVLSVLPALYILGARNLSDIAARTSRRRLTHAVAWSATVVWPALLFMFSSFPLSAAAITTHDAELSARAAFVREHFEPRTTLILTREDFLLVRYYLPEFRSRQYDPEPFSRGSRRMRTGRVERIVVFTPGLVPEQRPDVRRARCRDGIEFVYLDVIPGAVLEFKGERYAISAPTP